MNRPDPEPTSAAAPVTTIANPRIGIPERKWINHVLDSRQFSGRSSAVRRCEEAFAEHIGVRYAVACNSGGAALQLMMEAVDVRDREVIVPSFTMVATASSVVHARGTPVWAECDPATLCTTAEHVADVIGEKTKAVLCVHMYGLSCEMAALRKLCDAKNILLFEDAAEAHGSIYHGKRCGSLGFAAAFGFFANKIVQCGEGGMVTTDDAGVAEEVAKLRDYYCERGTHFWHERLGYSARMPALAAALLLGQLDRFEELRDEHARSVESFVALCEKHGLSQHPWLINKRHDDDLVCLWHYWLRVRDRQLIRQKLLDAGIETRPGFWPLHFQPCFQHTGVRRSSLAESERAGREVLLLPTYRLPGHVREKIVSMIAEHERA